jgi:hypothetical protein
MPWSRAFDEPISPPRGRQIVTLKDAANYIQKLPKAEQDLEEWQAAVEALLLVVELSGPTMMAAPITSAGRFSPLGPMGINRASVHEVQAAYPQSPWRPLLPVPAVTYRDHRLFPFEKGLHPMGGISL